MFNIFSVKKKKSFVVDGAKLNFIGHVTFIIHAPTFVRS